ncbi:MAG TPA: alpha/beta fold hydrolase [Nocardioides sp.]|nr:alpha/beta fold hydrolase [Nocardioides sp.]
MGNAGHRRVGAALVAVVGLFAAVLAPPPAGAQGEGEDLPVPYSFLTSAILAGIAPYADPPGANDWDCEPTRRHPRPVVLVHGLLGNKATNWQTYAPLLKNQGYCVFALTYGVTPGTPLPLDQFGGLTRIQDSARELKRFVRRVLRATGAREVDLLGHSEGTIVPNHYVKFLGGAKHVRRYVSIAPLWHGTDPTLGLATYGAAFGFPVDELPVCTSCGQFTPGSRFIERLRRGGVVVDGVEYTNIVTKYDQLVVPYTSGIQRGMTNHVLQDVCPSDFSEHFQVVASPVAARIVLNALDPARAEPVPCTLVLPYVGTPT